MKNLYLCIGIREETYSVTFFNNFNNFKAMSKKEFLAKKAAEKELKKVAIAKTGINVNYDSMSPEYKEFRCLVNKWQKDTREYVASLGFEFTKCVTFIVEKGAFGKTEKGKVLFAKLPDEVVAELNGEMADLEKVFHETVAGK